ncbi:MAG: hypothetical protein SCH98_05070 [Deferrisomatales bacterium]|nr:hypothetical protein [Deferrisomatales bacterium]
MRRLLPSLLALVGLVAPSGTLAQPPTPGLTVVYTVDERGEISPCG